MQDTTITIIGNLTDDPELRYTPSGAAVAKFRVASTPRYLDKASGQWKDAEPLFLACSSWRDTAEHVAESLSRGARVIVTGRLRQRSYETREGEKRTVMELEVTRSARRCAMPLRRCRRPPAGPAAPRPLTGGAPRARPDRRPPASSRTNRRSESAPWGPRPGAPRGYAGPLLYRRHA